MEINLHFRIPYIHTTDQPSNSNRKLLEYSRGIVIMKIVHTVPTYPIVKIEALSNRE